MSEDRRDEDHWRIDKRINVSMVCSALVFMASLVWWGANVESRFISIASDRVADQEKSEMQVQLINTQMKAASDRTEHQVSTINKNLDDIKQSVEKLSTKIERLN